MLRPFLALLLGLATVSSSTTTLWTKIDQTLKLTCPMPDDGEKLQICAWRFGDEGAFKSSFKKSHGDRISVKENTTDCMIRIERVEEDDEGIWTCKVHYQNKDGVSIVTEANRILYVAQPAQPHELTCPMPDEGENQRKSISNNSSQNNVAMDEKMPSVDKLSSKNSTPDHNSSRPAYLDKSSMKVSSMDKLSTKNCTLDYNSHKHSSLDKSAMKGSSMNRLSTNNSTLDNNSHKHSSVDKLSTKNTTNCISENCNSVTVERNDWYDWVSGILFFLVAGFLETNDILTKNVPFEFAYSLALSPSAAAGVAKSGELGIAFGSNGDILFFGSRCLGVKTDVSLEFDVVVGAWTSINYILGQNYAIGLGIDNVNFKNELGTEESGGNFEVLFNNERVIGGTVSLGRGVGYDLPINSEVNFEKCHTIELMRLDWRNFYSNMKK